MNPMSFACNILPFVPDPARCLTHQRHNLTFERAHLPLASAVAANAAESFRVAFCTSAYNKLFLQLRRRSH
jgi:hypothetical protein